jgi:DNA-binding protein HU-beta
MNKGKMTDIVAKKTGLTKDKSKKVINAILEAFNDALSSEGKIQLVGLGTFDVIERQGRAGRNPKTGEAIVIPTKKAIRFKAGKNLKNAVNGIVEDTETETETTETTETVVA